MVEYVKYGMSHIMSRILEVRYTDLEEEMRLCQELLALAKEQKDSYGQAYAYTYIGDYYIAIYDAQNAGNYLMKAEQLLQPTECFNELRLRIYSLLGIYNEMRADEQTAIEYYLEAIRVAEEIKDVEIRCAALNNLAFIFQRHGCYEEAFEYYYKAYQFQKTVKESPIRTLLLMNLAEISLMLHRHEEAKKYIEECSLWEKNEEQREIFAYKNWGVYYAAVGDREKSLKNAEQYLKKQEIINRDKLTAFASYHSLFRCMMNLGEKRHAKEFLCAMEAVCGGELDQIKVLEEERIKFSLLFEPLSVHSRAYKRFYEKNRAFYAKMNEGIANAMKSKIRMEQLMTQTKIMHLEQADLEREVNLDELTGLYSRGYLEGLMRKYDSTSPRCSIGLVLMDIDYFKEYNDYYGHGMGDTALQKIAASLKDSRKENIFPCRYGGDEFVCICEGGEEEIVSYIEAVRAYLRAKAIPHERSLCVNEVTLSIGYAIEEEVQVEVYELLRLADQALYESKRLGRNIYTRKRVAEL